MIRHGKVYCHDCHYFCPIYLGGSECHAPENTICTDKWYGIYRKYKRVPKKMNKLNNCPWFVQR